MATMTLSMVDADAMILAADPTVMTVLAVALECEMHTNTAAREAYARIYGREWMPLSSVQTAIDSEFYTGRAVGTDARTSVA